MRIDFSDYKSLINLMDNTDDYPEVIEGVNENGEWIFVKIYHDKIETKILQSNNWYRINVYWRDGTEEELYKKNK